MPVLIFFHIFAMQNSDEVTVTISEVFSKVWEVVKTPIGWLSALLLYLEPIRDVYILMIIVVVMDFFTGVGASAKRQIPRSSSRFKNSIIKCFCYFGAVFVFWQFEVRLELEHIIGSYKVIAGFIAIVETISILENMAVITGNSIFLKIVRFIRGRAREKHGDLIGDILEEKNCEYIPNKEEKNDEAK